MSLETLKSASRSELIERWTALFDQSPPSGLSQPMLVRILAWEPQARIHGGLSKRTRNRFKAIVKGKAKVKPVVNAPAGARLVREWNGVSHVVDVSEDGVLYRGECYASLSAVARRITGAHWSGPRFFGLSSRKVAS